MEPKSGAEYHIENADIDGQVIEKLGTVDKFGAHVKTDAAEIALVRKLDLYMLVSHVTKQVSFLLEQAG
jgi:hypothetical protein